MGVSRYTEADKADAIRRVQAGEQKTVVAHSLGCSPALIALWVSGLSNGTAKAKASVKTAASSSMKRSKGRAKRSSSADESNDDDAGAEVRDAEPMDVVDIIEAAALPYRLGRIVEAAIRLSEVDDFALLEQLEGDVARIRSGMEGRAA